MKRTSNETGLLSRNGVAGDGRGLSDMLVVTTTVRVIDTVDAKGRSVLRMNTRARGKGTHGFIATPRVLGQAFLFGLNLW